MFIFLFLPARDLDPERVHSHESTDHRETIERELDSVDSRFQIALDPPLAVAGRTIFHGTSSTSLLDRSLIPVADNPVRSRVLACQLHHDIGA